MSLKVQYETVEEAKMRLVGSIVRYNKEPVYVVDVKAGEANDVYRVHFVPLSEVGNDRVKVDLASRKYISSKHFDLSPFPIGNVNYEGEVLNCSRIAKKQVHQGLTQGTLSTSVLSSREILTPNFGKLVSTKGFINAVLGVYPSYKEAYAMVSEGRAHAVAFSRRFYLQKHNTLSIVYLVSDKDPIGARMKGLRAFEIADKYKFFKEELKEVGFEE